MIHGHPPLVAHVVYGFHVGGLENGIVNLINHMPSGRYRHVVIALTSADPAFHARIHQRVELIQLHKSPGHGARLYPTLWRLFRSLRPAIVHTRNLAALEMAVPAWAARVPVRIHGEHGWDTADPDAASVRHRVLRRVYSPFVSHYVALSEHLADYLLARVGIMPRRVSRICNGVDASRFSPSAVAASDIPFARPGHWIVGSVGRLQEIKDPLNLVRAFALWLGRDGEARQRARLVMVGDGPLGAEVKQAVVAAGLADHVWLPGARDDVPALMSGMDCFALPSRAEGISNTLLEAMACGCPVVATAVGGNAELVVPGQTGWLVPSGNPAALADALAACFRDPGDARKRGAAGRRRVEADFSLESMVARYLDCYDRLLGGRSARATFARPYQT
jgi:sugar transferase (PEP-CTERM/EpsH1 system associated)